MKPITVFLFPGQGSQEVAMARDLFAGDEYFASLIHQASDIVQEDLKPICLKGPERILSNPRVLQPLLVCVSLGYLKRIQTKGIIPDFLLGHSLGEITALAAGAVISDAMALSIAARRGVLMEEAARLLNAGMMAVSLSEPETRHLLDIAQLQDKVFISNVNAPDQTVVSGDLSSLAELAAWASKRTLRTKKLPVSGPWHSPYMEHACQEFQAWSEALVFQQPHIPIVLNATGQTEGDPEKIKSALIAQMKSPVYFSRCLDYLAHQQANIFLEIGPGRILSGLVRANGFTGQVRVFCVNDLRGVEGAAAELLKC